jgi:hypothetical protein
MMFVATDPEAEPFDPAFDNIEEWVEKLDASGKRVMGERLRRPEDAKTVRRRKGQLLVTDGPFAETREVLGGYYLIDVPDLDAAIDWAAKCPGAKYGSVEVRPIMEFDSGS